MTLLLDSGVDLHSCQPTAEDIITISSCDVFVYTGGESDKWVEDVLDTAHNPNLKAISMIECVEAKEEEIIEGMQESEHDHEHDHEQDDEHEHEHHHEIEYDEHVWLSLRNACPDDYPKDGEVVTVTGVFNTYIEGDYLFCRLENGAIDA